MPQLQKSIQYIKGVGPSRAKLFQQLGVETIEDLMYLFPRRYEDRSKLIPLKKVEVGQWHTVGGEVVVRGARRSRLKRRNIIEVVIGDDTGRISCVFFNQPYLEKYFNVGDQIVLYGRIDQYKDHLQMVSPDFELIDEKDDQLNTGRIVPIYPLTKGISQRYLRKIMHTCLEEFAHDVEDLLPSTIRKRNRLKDLSSCIQQIHFPDNTKQQEQSMQRISFEEFFFFQLAVIARRKLVMTKNGLVHQANSDLIKEFMATFPFKLTAAQQRCLKEIVADMKKPSPMLRLLQGDVGSGKTVISFFGCVVAYANGYQSAIMAPTEILARQHFNNFNDMLKGAPFGSMTTAFLHSGLTKKERTAMLKDISEGKVDLVVGTHALIQDDVTFKNLSFITIDEQHKFGVKQRALLSSKGSNPDVLIMTATPIPRTLCLTLYGDLDVSVIDEYPKGRGKIQTYLFPSEHEEKVYRRVSEWVAKGTQAYIVFPLVEESEELDLKSAVDMHRRFQKDEFRNFRVGLIHGQMDRKEVQVTMEKFKKHDIDILVTTTVLEVGIDVGNANVMVIEHAERFGLSQLHQLRGRIGRSEKNAVCVLVGDPKNQDGARRLDAIVASTDGFKIAEHDLEIRGPGQYFGRHQHGLNELAMINPLMQQDTLESARHEAQELMKKDPHFKQAANKKMKKIINIRYPQYLDLTSAG